MSTVTPRIIRSGDCRVYDRIIVQLDGPPMALTHGAGSPVALEPLVPHGFSGDDETACDVAGVAHDFNLIVRRVARLA